MTTNAPADLEAANCIIAELREQIAEQPKLLQAEIERQRAELHEWRTNYHRLQCRLLTAGRVQPSEIQSNQL